MNHEEEEKKNINLAIFDDFPIRRHYDEEKEMWFFSVIDIIAALTNQKDHLKARKYWNKLAGRLRVEGSELVTKCHQLKMLSTDGKYYKTNVASVETILRLIQSVPSKNAEPIKIWLAKVGYERMQEISNPELSINRARDNWKKRGRSDKWIGQRMMGQETRNKLTDYWDKHGVKKGSEFAILTNIIHMEWSEVTITEHKKLKGINKDNLRDHMTEAELIFTSLAELSTRQIAEGMQTEGLESNKVPARKGGKIAKNARKELEEKTGKKVVTGGSFLKI